MILHIETINFSVIILGRSIIVPYPLKPPLYLIYTDLRNPIWDF